MSAYLHRINGGAVTIVGRAGSWHAFVGAPPLTGGAIATGATRAEALRAAQAALSAKADR